MASTQQITGVGVVDVVTGFRQGTMTAGRYLRSNGTNFVSNTIQAGDIPDLSGSYDVAGAASSAISTHQSTYNHSNYNTAYGWGNHASAGYATGALSSTSSFNLTIGGDTVKFYRYNLTINGTSTTVITNVEVIP